MSDDQATDSPDWADDADRDNEQAREHEVPEGAVVDGITEHGDDVHLFAAPTGRLIPLDEQRRRDNLPPVRIAGALVKAQSHVRGVAKSKQAGKDGGDWKGYKFASAEAIIEEARTALHSAGLAVLVPTWREVARDRLELDAMVVHESGDVWVVFPRPTGIIVEGKGRPRDKAIMAAMTYTTQYMLRGLLQIPRPDGSEQDGKSLAVDDRDDREYQPRQERARSQERQRERIAERREFKGGAMLFAGKHTGKPIADASDEGLRAHLKNIEAHIASAAPENVHPHMLPHIAELEAELEGRAAEAALAPTDDEPAGETIDPDTGEVTEAPDAEATDDEEADRLEAEAMQAEASDEGSS